MASPETMRALALNDTEDRNFVEMQIPRPEAGAGQVLVRIKASGVNPIDSKIRTGQYGHTPALPRKFPAILGTDLAGVVEAVGPGVTAFKAGDEVYGLTGGIADVPGSLAEFAAVDANLLALKPKNISFREAAGIPLVFLTAWEGLVDATHVGAGQKVLVLGAGGVGHMAIQIAHAHGAEVFATESEAKREVVESFGATWIDRDSDVDTYVNKYTGGQGFDIVLDSVGGKEGLEQAIASAAIYGHVASSQAFVPINLALASLKGVSVTGVYVLLPLLAGKNRAHHGDILRKATELVETGKVRVMVDPKRFDLSNALAAHEALLGRKIVGKAVIDVA